MNRCRGLAQIVLMSGSCIYMYQFIDGSWGDNVLLPLTLEAEFEALNLLKSIAAPKADSIDTGR
jgi:hypothetical protein